MSAEDWLDDVTEPDDSDDSPSLFEENFEQMIEDGELDSMAVKTLEDQIERIEDPEILHRAIEAEDRTTAVDAYEARLGEIEAEAVDESEGSDDEDGEEILEEPPEDLDPEDLEEDTSEAESEETDVEDAEEDEAEADPDDGEDDGSAEKASSDPEPDTTNLPEVDVGSLAPSATSREEAAEGEEPRTLLVWGPEGAGKSHTAHSAPEPIAYIDTEGKATELAEKFDKEIVYWQADDYEEAAQALDEALDLLDAYLEAGVRGTLVVDSMTAMWEYAKVDYAEYAYQTDDLTDVNFQSQLEGEKDWTQIKARHNSQFREKILEAPFHVVFTAGQKEDYNAVFEGDGKQWIPDGEKWNRYAVKDVVRLRRDGQGRTVADLRKAAKTRYSFMGLLWPEWDDIYGAVDQIHEADQAEEPIDLSDWEFDVVDGQPVTEPSDSGSSEEDDE